MHHKSESIAKLTEALANAQKSFGHAKKDTKNQFFSSKYADLASVIDACRMPLAGNGLAVIQTFEDNISGAPCICTTLSHVSGEWVASYFPIVVTEHTPRDGKQGPNKMQSWGSAVTYARRYALQAIIGVAASEDDDDGNAAGSHGPKPAPAKAEPAKPRPEAGMVRHVFSPNFDGNPWLYAFESQDDAFIGKRVIDIAEENLKKLLDEKVQERLHRAKRITGNDWEALHWCAEMYELKAEAEAEKGR